MTNTFNRRPLTVNTPSKNDIGHNYFNHYNWKGLIDNKNFLSAEQESFSDCNNVYVDEQGLLKSRPSIKIKTISIVNGEEKLQLGDIINLWNFIDTTVYESKYNDKYYLTFVNEMFTDKNLQIELNYLDDNNYISYSEVKLVIADRKVFVFSEHSFNYYDMNTNEYLSAEDYIYVPLSKLYVDGVEQTTSPETKNILTTSEIYRHLYTNIELANLTDFVGKKLKITIDEVEYTINFKSKTNLILVGKYTSLTNENFVSNDIVGENVEDYPLIQISDKENMLISSYTNVLVESEVNGHYYIKKLWTIYYTVDGLTFELLPTQPSFVYGFPHISSDGNYAIIFSENGPLIYSLTETENGFKKYNNWTNLFETLDVSFYNNYKMNLMEIPTNYYPTDYTYSQINGHFITDDNFSIIYSEGADEKYFNSLYCIQCVNGKLSKNVIFAGISNAKVDAVDTQEKSYVNQDTNENYIYVWNFDNININYETNIYYNATKLSGFANITNIKVVKQQNKNDNSLTYTFNYNYEITLNGILIQSGIYSNSDKVIYANNKTIYDNNLFKFTLGPDSEYMELDCEAKTSFIGMLNNNKVFMNNITPNIHCQAIQSGTYLQTIISFNALIDGLYDSNFKYCIITNENTTSNKYFLKQSSSNNCLYYDIKINDNKIYFVEKDDVNYLISYEVPITDNYPKLEYISNKSYLTNSDKVKFSNDAKYLLTSKELIDLSSDEIIPLLFECYPLSMIFINNYKLYLCNKDFIYCNTSVKKIEIDEIVQGKINNILFDKHIELQQHYFSKDKSLYISEYKTDKNNNFLWYLPEINKQDYNFNITNIHPISSTEIAIFFPNEIYYTIYDTNTLKYYVYKTKLQVGCKKGSDVITTFDGKYVIFPSERGLVAMSYQQFVATTEQTLTYLSDNIYKIFYSYITENNSYNEIKLFKYSYWIFIYKQDSKKGFLLDVRTMSWWPVEGINNTIKIVEINNEITLLSNNKLFSLDKSEVNYYDYDGELKNKINWFIKSQKLYLNAINYYKHIVNITFLSVHDIESLNKSQYNIKDLNLKLQVNNYRKKMNGNIDNLDDYSIVNYDIDIVKTYIQRLNYSKVNEFQYMLSYDNNIAINIPLSLSGIIIKYKIGGQIR